MIYLLMSCGCERELDLIVVDAYDIGEGDKGWCEQHATATVVALHTQPKETRDWLDRLRRRMGARA